MPDLFQYTDYRRYLADFYAARKANLPSFSYEHFSRKAGLQNKGFLFNVIAGRRTLSAANCRKLAAYVASGEREAEYFQNLVAFNQAKSVREASLYFEKLSGIKSNRPGGAQVRELRRDQYEFYSRWYYAAIRSLLEMHRFRGDWHWLARKLWPAIGVREARKAVTVLERLGLVSRDHEGVYRVTDKHIRPGPEVERLAVRRFHLESARLAADSIEKQPVDRRNITGLTLGISLRTYQRICDEVQRFRSRLVALAEADFQADEVYQLNLQLYPMSNAKVKESAR